MTRCLFLCFCVAVQATSVTRHSIGDEANSVTSNQGAVMRRQPHQMAASLHDSDEGDAGRAENAADDFAAAVEDLLATTPTTTNQISEASAASIPAHLLEMAAPLAATISPHGAVQLMAAGGKPTAVGSKLPYSSVVSPGEATTSTSKALPVVIAVEAAGVKSATVAAVGKSSKSYGIPYENVFAPKEAQSRTTSMPVPQVLQAAPAVPRQIPAASVARVPAQASVQHAAPHAPQLAALPGQVVAPLPAQVPARVLQQAAPAAPQQMAPPMAPPAVPQSVPVTQSAQAVPLPSH